jgi:hypothetical protein
MFWKSDNLSDYEIWSQPSAIGIFYAKGPYPYQVPFLTAPHTPLDKHGEPVLGRDGKPMSYRWSPFINGECDYWRDQRAIYDTWAHVGDVHKRRVTKVNQPLVLRQSRKRRFDYKPDSPLVLLFWARQIIAWHYLRYWMKGDEDEKDISRKVRLEAAE